MQPHMQQQIKAQHMSWGQGCSPTFIVNSLLLWSNSALLQITPLPLCTFLTYKIYVVVVTATTLLLKLDAWVHD